MFLRNELRAAITENRIQKYHFNFLRNLFEKTATFLGYMDWKDLLPREADDAAKLSYAKRILDISSHSQYSGEEVSSLNPREKVIWSGSWLVICDSRGTSTSTI